MKHQLAHKCDEPSTNISLAFKNAVHLYIHTYIRTNTQPDCLPLAALPLAALLYLLLLNLLLLYLLLHMQIIIDGPIACRVKGHSDNS